jgi:anti-sigma B factor antagonist
MAPLESTYEVTTIMNDITTVMLPKQVDSETSTSVETLIVDALRPGAGLIVDGSEVTYMSAAGVRVFARALHRAEEIGARIAFCRFTGAAADCLLVSGFTELFEVVDSVEEAATRLRRKSAGSAAERLHPHTRAG